MYSRQRVKSNSSVWKLTVSHKGLIYQRYMSKWFATVRFWRGYRAYWRGRYQHAFVLLEPLAKTGHAAAQFYLGRMCARAEGTERDIGNAIRWWNASAGAGEPWAQVAIGCLYERGALMPRDRPKALKWYLKAARSGLPEAQLRVGYFYESGFGVERDLARARRWYLEASESEKRRKRTTPRHSRLNSMRRDAISYQSRRPYLSRLASDRHPATSQKRDSRSGLPLT